MNEQNCALAFKGMSDKQRKRFIKRMAKEVRSEIVCVRGFAIIDGSKMPTKSIPSVVFHITTGLWRGYDVPFADMIEYLNTHPQKDAELISDIYDL